MVITKRFGRVPLPPARYQLIIFQVRNLNNRNWSLRVWIDVFRTKTLNKQLEYLPLFPGTPGRPMAGTEISHLLSSEEEPKHQQIKGMYNNHIILQHL